MKKNCCMYKFRIYPTNNQKNIIEQTFRVCSEVHNLILKERTYVYNKFIVYVQRCLINNIKIEEDRFFKHNKPRDLEKMIKNKSNYENVDSLAIHNEHLSVMKAYDRYFEGTGNFPTCKMNMEYRTNNINNGIRVINNNIILPKLGIIKADIDKNILDNISIKKAIVKLDKYGRYYVTLVLEKIPNNSLKTLQSINIMLN